MLAGTASWADVTIDETNFPDAVSYDRLVELGKMFIFLVNLPKFAVTLSPRLQGADYLTSRR